MATHTFVGELYAQLMHGGRPSDRLTTAIGTNLEKISLPGLSGLDWSEVKAIRNDEGSFRRWRADLQDVIATVDPSLPPAEYIDRFNAIARARLGRAALDVERELKESAALTRLRTGAVSFAIGAVAAVFNHCYVWCSGRRDSLGHSLESSGNRRRERGFAVPLGEQAVHWEKGSSESLYSLCAEIGFNPRRRTTRWTASGIEYEKTEMPYFLPGSSVHLLCADG